jgi:phenylacetate-CoA ligase
MHAFPAMVEVNMNAPHNSPVHVIVHDREALADLSPKLTYELNERGRRLCDRWELLNTQHQQLEEMLSSALATSQYYRRLATKGGFTPHDGLAAFHQLPLLTRSSYAMHLDQIRVAARYSCYRDSTSGTSGSPIEVFRDSKSVFLESRRFADILKYYLGDPARLRSGRMTIVYVSHYATSDEHVYEDPVLCAKIMKVRCDGGNLRGRLRSMGCELEDECFVLTGTVSSLLYLATCEQALSGLPLAAAVLPSGEVLRVQARSILEEAFLAPVAELYTLRECGTIAFQCRCGPGLHVEADWFVMEVLDNDGRSVPDGTAGDLIVTDLTNSHVPLLRYATGDVGSLQWTKCVCGLSLPLLSGLSGRKPVYFAAAEGTLVDTATFAKHLERLPVLWYRVTQDASGEVNMEYCSTGTDVSGRMGALCSDLKLALGLAKTVNIRSVSMEEADLQGKSGGFIRSLP